MRRLFFAVATVGAIALTVGVSVLCVRHREESLAGSSAVIALQAAAAAALIAAGALESLVLLGAGIAVDLAALPLPYAGGAVLFTAALVLAAAPAPLAAVYALGRAAIPAVGVAVLWAGLLPSLVFDPREAGCFACPGNLALVRGDATLRAHFLSSGLRASAVLLGLAGVALVVRATRGRPGAALTAAVATGAAGIGLAHRADGGSAAIDHTSRLAWAVTCAALLGLAVVPMFEVARVWVESTRIVDAVLQASPTLEELRLRLAASAGDDDLVIEFPGVGVPVEGAVTTDVVRSGKVVARLRHRRLQPAAASRLAAAIRAAGLAIEHAAARARLRAQLDELTASRARIVEVADAERRRIERDLHDGAQQRLIALSVGLSGRNGSAAEARGEVLAALEELRTLAHGIHPASLTEGGVVTSVQELADSARVPLRLDVRPLERLPAAVEAAAYRVIADCVRAAERGGRAVTVEIAMTDRDLTARLRLDRVPPALVRRTLAHAADRVVAVGGRVDVTERAGETLVGLTIRCGS